MSQSALKVPESVPAEASATNDGGVPAQPGLRTPGILRPPRKWRGWVARLALGGFVLLLVLQFITSIGNTAVSDSPGGRSSFSRDATGLAALAQLYDSYGIDVDQARGALSAAPDPAVAVLLIDPPELPAAEATVLTEFIAGGGRLVTGAPRPAYLALLSRNPPEWAPATRDRWDARALDPALGDVFTANEGEWQNTGGGRPAVGSPTQALLTIEPFGRGEIWFLADTTLLTNELLTEADNAAFALALAGDRDSIVFIEGVHGAQVATGLGAIPDRWKAALAGIVIAGLVYMWARGTRFGPPEPAHRDLDPPRVAYVLALAATLARTRDQRSALERSMSEPTPSLGAHAPPQSPPTEEPRP